LVINIRVPNGVPLYALLRFSKGKAKHAGSRAWQLFSW